MTTAPNRLDALLQNATLTGIDFIYVYPTQVQIDVYFLWKPALHNPADPPLPALPIPMPLVGGLAVADIQIYDPAAETPDIQVLALAWGVVDGRDVARLTLDRPGDFTRYKLRIDDLRVDSFYNDVFFSFKANCPSDLDCAPAEPDCPPTEPVDAPIDYLARDFWSFRRALLDFAHLRYPDWPDRLEADTGVMLAEVMSALGDEMTYYQDHVGHEAYLETATQRRSVRRHARLVDYTLADGSGATTWLDITVANGASNLPTGMNVWAMGYDGTRLDFELGRGLFDPNLTYAVAAACNAFQPHLWDEDTLCLPVGTTSLAIEGHHKAHLPVGKWVLLTTQPPNAAQPTRTQMVRLTKVDNERDPVLNANITRLKWADEHALTAEFDLTCLTLRGNLVPVTAGLRHVLYGFTGQHTDQLPLPQQTALHARAEQDRADLHLSAKSGRVMIEVAGTVERQGHDGTLTHLLSLPKSDEQTLVWLTNELGLVRPEIKLEQLRWNAGAWQTQPLNASSWEWRQSLMGVNSSESGDTHFTLDDGLWRRVVGYRHGADEFVHRDYATDQGQTIRFGDGEFGQTPARNTLFRVEYRLGPGQAGNVSVGVLRGFDQVGLPANLIQSVENPLPATNGADPESLARVRQLAPDAFRALTYRAVRPEDYAEAAERLPWVQRAGAEFRYTGSWLTAFTTPDPRGMVGLPDTRAAELTAHLDRFRMTGRESWVRPPLYANLDVQIEVCAQVSAYPGELQARLLTVLLGKNGQPGYFSPDRFTFGTPFDRSTLEAAIQRVPGVNAVEGIRIRRRGWFNWQPFTDLAYNPGPNTIIRVANDPLHPDRGTLTLSIHGGA